jgi:hypothetical protein
VIQCNDRAIHPSSVAFFLCPCAVSLLRPTAIKCGEEEEVEEEAREKGEKTEAMVQTKRKRILVKRRMRRRLRQRSAGKEGVVKEVVPLHRFHA